MALLRILGKEASFGGAVTPVVTNSSHYALGVFVISSPQGKAEPPTAGSNNGGRALGQIFWVTRCC